MLVFGARARGRGAAERARRVGHNIQLGGVHVDASLDGRDERVLVRKGDRPPGAGGLKARPKRLIRS